MLTRALIATASVMLAGTSFAQTTSTEAEQPAVETPVEQTETPAVPSDLNMGIVEPTEPQVGEFYLRDSFDDWALRCVKSEDGNDPCQMFQLLLDNEGNAVAEISLFPLPDGGEAAAGATVVVPLETLLTENLRISVDNGPDRIYPFSFCNRAGCVSRVGFTNQDIAAFKAGSEATLTIVPYVAPDEQVDLSISLAGFTAAYTADYK